MGPVHRLVEGLERWTPFTTVQDVLFDIQDGDGSMAVLGIHLKAFDADQRLLMRRTYVSGPSPPTNQGSALMANRSRRGVAST